MNCVNAKNAEGKFMSKQPESTLVGEMSAMDSFALLKMDKDAALIDVRTHAEWSYVGVADLAELGKRPLFHQWQVFPSMQIDVDFVPRLKAALAAAGAGVDAPLLFLCRSGVRSLAAGQAMAAAGHSRCINVTGGFEGPPDANKHRGQISGWKASVLPWTQP